MHQVFEMYSSLHYPARPRHKVNDIAHTRTHTHTPHTCWLWRENPQPHTFLARAKPPRESRRNHTDLCARGGSHRSRRGMLCACCCLLKCVRAVADKVRRVLAWSLCVCRNSIAKCVKCESHTRTQMRPPRALSRTRYLNN